MEEKATEGMEKQAAKVRCQRMGCDVMFSPDDNPDDSCQYHDSVSSFRSNSLCLCHGKIIVRIHSFFSLRKLLIGWILLKPNVMSLNGAELILFSKLAFWS